MKIWIKNLMYDDIDRVINNDNIMVVSYHNGIVICKNCKIL